MSGLRLKFEPYRLRWHYWLFQAHIVVSCIFATPHLNLDSSLSSENKCKTPLPTRDGVSPSYIYLPPGAWTTVFAFLLARFPAVDANIWLARIERGEVVDAQGRPISTESPYRAGAQIYYYREVKRETPVPFDEFVLYQDEHIVVADKPHFLSVIPRGEYLQNTLLVRLKKKLCIDDLVPIHRLDRETAGVMIFSCNANSRSTYQSLFLNRQMDKVYEALAPALPHQTFPLTYRSRIVDGEPFYRSKQIDGDINAETVIDVIEQRGDLWRYQLHPISGRKHQLRVHMSALGAPIVNDNLYPTLQPHKGDDYTHPLKLLARSISFTDPISGNVRVFRSERQL